MTTMRGGIDLGGTKIQAVVVDDGGTVTGAARRQTPTEGTKGDVIRAMADTLSAAAQAAVDAEDSTAVEDAEGED